MRPVIVPSYIKLHNQQVETLTQRIRFIKIGLQRFYSPAPDISIIIPAYNEEENILKTLSSLSVSATKKTFEVIVVNNNSQDTTGQLALQAGAVCIQETNQGITHARNAGLRVAKGMFILNADADTIYPPAWIDLMTAPLYRDDVALTYGLYAFIPAQGTWRLVYFGYETIAGISKWLNRFREEAVNVYGFNSGFRRQEGIQVKGYDHPPGTNEDGWLACKLRDSFAKKLYRVSDSRAMVWTTDRRIQADGGLIKGTVKRLKRHSKPF